MIKINQLISLAAIAVFSIMTMTAVNASASEDIKSQIDQYRKIAKASIKPADCNQHLPVSLTSGGSCYTAQGYVAVKKGSFVQVYEPKSKKVVYSLSLNKNIQWQGHSIDPKSFLP